MTAKEILEEIKPLGSDSYKEGEKIGPVTADLGNNACQVPFAPDYINKATSKGSGLVFGFQIKL